MRHDENINQLLEATAYDRNGDRIGGVSGVYLDDHTGEPMWVTVNTGFFGLSSSFAPLAGSSLDGDSLTLAADKDQVKDAPNVDEDGHITREQEDELYRYYQVDTAEVEAERQRTRRWDRDYDRDLDERDHDRSDDLLDRDGDGRGPVGEVLDGPDRGGPLDRDADGRGPIEEVLDGPDNVHDEANERYVDDEVLRDLRHDEPGIQDDFVEGDLSGRPLPDAADGPLGEPKRGADPIDNIFDAPDQGNPRHL
ncbi:MAG: PRC-barrel domain-containing protein [Propionibacteriaceae bacterium]|nr:PRC-barrel domain-containing protein [Propionibacteriaceae bacterium]